MSTIFLSYRRGDTGGEAGRLADTFQQKLGGAMTFRDVTNIALGEQFDSALTRELASAQVVVVLIGPSWLDELVQRLDKPGVDYVRVEVAAALRKGKRVIPVLVRGAELPPLRLLPEDLASLAKRQAMTLRDESWSQDVDRLIGAIGRPYRWSVVALRVILALIFIVVGVKLLLPSLPADRANDVVFLRVLVGSLLAVYLVIEAALAFRYFKNLKHGWQLQNLR